jgi:hypothetical protein
MHSTIGDLTPVEFIENHQTTTHAAMESTSVALVCQSGKVRKWPK